MYSVFAVGTIFISIFLTVLCFVLFVNMNDLELIGNGSIKVTKLLIYQKRWNMLHAKGKTSTVLEFYIIL